MNDIMTLNSPKDWKLHRLGQLFRERKEKGSDKDFSPLSVTMRGIVPQLESAAKSDDGDNRKVVRVGDYAINSRSDRKGSGGISDHEGSVSLISIVLQPRDIDRRFSHHLLRSPAFQEEFYRWGHGIVADLWTTRYSDMKNIRLRVPDLPTQREIADFLDRETARIDSLIEKKQQLVDMIAPRFEALIHVARETGDWRRFGYSAQTTMRPIPLSSGAAYVPLGLYNRGRGFFQKPETAYDDLGDSSFCFVRKGDLVFSGQFAWEGAVGLVSDKEHDCVVSHRYPVYTGIEGILSEYLFAYFRSHHGQFLMDNCSRGAAGRNRPLNTRILEKEKIPVPSIELQKQVATLIEFERRLKDKTSPSIDRLKEYRSALITSAVTGQIDVSTYARSGTTDRQLDAIQSEMQA
ncbi:MAG: restriction endonuclease subunit S [Pseudomonadota bacterium]|nr:restriction endonuclease subunit S [Pseudomonadota bacterium]